MMKFCILITLCFVSRQKNAMLSLHLSLPLARWQVSLLIWDWDKNELWKWDCRIISIMVIIHKTKKEKKNWNKLGRCHCESETEKNSSRQSTLGSVSALFYMRFTFCFSHFRQVDDLVDWNRLNRIIVRLFVSFLLFAVLFGFVFTHFHSFLRHFDVILKLFPVGKTLQREGQTKLNRIKYEKKKLQFSWFFCFHSFRWSVECDHWSQWCEAFFCSQANSNSLVLSLMYTRSSQWIWGNAR